MTVILLDDSPHTDFWRPTVAPRPSSASGQRPE
jgi:hypothetical protein